MVFVRCRFYCHGIYDSSSAPLSSLTGDHSYCYTDEHELPGQHQSPLLMTVVALKSGVCLGAAVTYLYTTGIRVHLTSYLPDVRTEAFHWHENAHLSLVLQGGNLEKRMNTQTERLPGSVTFYQAGETHQTIHKCFPATHINLELEESFFKQHLISPSKMPNGKLETPRISLSILKIYQELQFADALSADSIQMLTHGLMDSITSPTRSIPNWVQLVKQLLNDQWNEPLTLVDLARAVQLHPVTISKYFPLYFQCTIGDYVRQLRVAKAAQLIQSSTYSLTEIAFECGFADQSHFARTFRQLTGFSPKAYQLFTKGRQPVHKPVSVTG